MCSYLSVAELLVALAGAARTTRELLTPACFSVQRLSLGARQLSILSSLAPWSSLSLRPFYGRVLSECRLTIHPTTASIGMQQVLDALDHFPVCSSLCLFSHRHLDDRDLHGLLHHPSSLACEELILSGFSRRAEQDVAMHGQQSQTDALSVRWQRKRTAYLKPSQKEPFSWATIRLPSATRLTLVLVSGSHYSGVDQFLTAHTALLELSVSTLFVSLDKLKTIFQDPAALPQLTHLRLSEREEAGRPSLSAVVTALATTAVGVTGKPRPMTRLILNMPTPRDVLPAAALMPALTRLEINDACPGWLAEWTNTQTMLAAWPQLEELVVHAGRPRRAEQDARVASQSVADMQPFLQSMASRPIQLIDLRIGVPVVFNAAAMAELARCRQLRQLALDFSIAIYDEKVWIDWTNSALSASFSLGCFPCLRSVTLHVVKLSAAAVLAIASAAPQLRTFSGSGLELSCHPAILCAIIGGCCEHIEEVSIDDVCCHVWRGVQAEDVAGAYQSAVAAAGRGSTYRPFTQLRRLRASMCWCTPASAWHALLSLLRWAVRLQGVAKMSSDDPLLICALSYLPSITELGADCLWPRSFAELMERKSEESGQYCFVTADELHGRETSKYHAPDATVELSDNADGDYGAAVSLRPHPSLIAAYQQSLSAEQQAVLARWARGDFHAGDDKQTAAEGVLEPDELRLITPAGHRHCPHPPRLIGRSVHKDEPEEPSDDELE